MGANLGKSLDWHGTVLCDNYATFIGMSIVLYCHYATLVDISLGRHDTLHESRQTWLFYVSIISH